MQNTISYSVDAVANTNGWSDASRISFLNLLRINMFSDLPQCTLLCSIEEMYNFSSFVGFLAVRKSESKAIPVTGRGGL
jgi:hypothetical protein